MIQFPTIVYKSPGSRRNAHGTYDYVGVKTQEEFDRRIADGWHPSRAAAFASLKQPQPPEVTSSPAPIPDDQPTRAELEQKALALGLKFDGRTTDKKLLERIEQALGG
jgi:hypothetical protein